MTLFLPILLVAFWLLAWGEITVANVLSGTVLVVLLLVTFPAARRSGPRARIRPVATGRLILYVIGQLVVSNVLVAREILSRRSSVKTGVLRFPLSRPSDVTTTLIASIIALTPGTMTVDVTSDPAAIDVHFLLLSDVDAARATVARLEQLVLAVFGEAPRDETEAVPNEENP